MTTTTEYTRKQVLNNECTHRQYYAQFVTEGYKNYIQDYIGLEKLLNTTDEHFNDIPLKVWDNAPMTLGVNQKMQTLGDYLTMSGKVCIAKEAARQIIEDHN